METIYEKHKISIIEGKRYYEYDVGNSLPMDLESSTPYCFELFGEKIFENTWSHLTIKILEKLDWREPKQKEELLSLKYTFSNASPFSNVKRTNYLPFKDVFLDVNHTAPHSLMSIQTFLSAYGVSFNDCRLWIRRRYANEPDEVKDYVTAKAKKGLSCYLALKGLNENSQKNVLSSVGFLNQTLVSFAKNYESFFLFDNAFEFYEYQYETMKRIKAKYFTKEKLIEKAKRYFNYLYEYIKNRDFYDNFNLGSVPSSFVGMIKKELDNTFRVLNSPFINAKKFYNRIRLCYPEELRELPLLNDPMHLFAYASYLGKGSYYFEYPYICKEKRKGLTGNDILTEFVYSKEEIDVKSISAYADKMCIKKPGNFLDFLLSLSDDYMLIGVGKVARISSLGISKDQVEAVEKDLSFFLSSYREFDSEKNTYYKFLPSLSFVWDKNSLLGFANSFLKEKIEVIISNAKSSDVRYVLYLKAK